MQQQQQQQHIHRHGMEVYGHQLRVGHIQRVHVDTEHLLDIILKMEE